MLLVLLLTVSVQDLSALELSPRCEKQTKNLISSLALQHLTLICYFTADYFNNPAVYSFSKGWKILLANSCQSIAKNIRFVEPSKLYKYADNNFFALFVSLFTDFSLL